MSTREMVENFPPPQVLKAIENGKKGMPSDPAKRAIYQSRMAAMEDKQQKKQDQEAADKLAAAAIGAKVDKDVAESKDMAAVAESKPARDASDNMQPERRKTFKEREAAMYADLQADSLLSMPADQRYKSILAMRPEERLDLARRYRGERATQLLDGMRPEQRETIEAIVNPQVVVGGELSEAKLLRAIYSQRQLEEVMTDFWYNHFNVFINKGPDRYMVTAYERDVIRPHVLGKFKDLLSATAHSPAMLFYLDNWESMGPNSEQAIFGPRGPR